MLEQLKQLEEVVQQARRQHHLVATELANAKHKPAPAQTQQIASLEHALEAEKLAHSATLRERDALMREIDALKAQCQSLHSAQHKLSQEGESWRLQAEEARVNVQLLQNELTAQKHKNDEAQRRAALVIERLKMIDTH